MLNEIKTLLNIEVKLMEEKLENGTVVSAEAFEKGKEIFIVTDDEKVAMPVGEYILEDGRLVVIEAEGIIADVREVSDEVPAKEEEETEDLGEEKEMEEEVKEEMSYATKEELAEVKTMVEEIRAMLEPKEEMSEEVKEEEIVEEVKEELSAVKPIKHNPEASTPQKKQVQFAKGQFNTTLDRVLSKLNK